MVRLVQDMLHKLSCFACVPPYVAFVLQDGDAVNKLGAELMQLFMLHSELYQLAMEGGKAGSKKGRKPGGSAAAADGSSQVLTPSALLLVRFHRTMVIGTCSAVGCFNKID